MYYVYIIRFITLGKFYTGLTSNLKSRLNAHRRTESKITNDLGKFELKFVSLFPNKFVAARFEKYLKGHLGRAFRNKHLI